MNFIVTSATTNANRFACFCWTYCTMAHEIFGVSKSMAFLDFRWSPRPSLGPPSTYVDKNHTYSVEACSCWGLHVYFFSVGCACLLWMHRGFRAGSSNWKEIRPRQLGLTSSVLSELDKKTLQYACCWGELLHHKRLSWIYLYQWYINMYMNM